MLTSGALVCSGARLLLRYVSGAIPCF
ncbi:MAG: hypothetical protein DRR42_19020 [Gammaproteobacteria bacterium]|nr:MAG: hypothetical protein DRR42_19020 [Gammaproteobacteria bacterium]